MIKFVAPLCWAIGVSVLAGPGTQDSGPLRGLDHVMVAVRSLPSAAERYRALGFALKPGRPHDNGIQNEHVKFADGTELELITAPAAVDGMTTNYVAHLKGGDGPAYGGFFAPDRAALAARLKALGATNVQSGIISTFPDGSPLKHLFFGSRNQSPTDKPEHFAHANGAESLIGVWVATDESHTRDLLGGLGVAFETARVELPDVTTVQRGRLAEGEVLILPGSRQLVPGRRIVGVTMRTRSLEAVRSALAKAPAPVRDAVVWRARSAFLPPSITFGVWIELRAAGT